MSTPQNRIPPPSLEDLDSLINRIRGSMGSGTSGTSSNDDPSLQYTQAFNEATTKYNLPPNLLREVARQESEFNPNAVSNKGAIGLMQIVPRHHPSVDPTDPFASIDYAGKFLRQLHDQFGDWNLALAGYNAGAGNVQRYGGIPPFAETQDYISRINSRLRESNARDAQINNRFRPVGDDIVDPLEDEINQIRASMTGNRNIPSAPNPQEEERERSFAGDVGRGIVGTLKTGAQKFGEFRQRGIENLDKETPTGQTRREVIEQVRQSSDPGFVKHLAPAGIGAGGGVGRILGRRFSPFRKAGEKLANRTRDMGRQIPRKQGALEVAADEGLDAVNIIRQRGYDLWKDNLGGMNPSEMARFMDDIPVAHRELMQRGMIESLTENLANMGRLTKEAQQKLLSPAGRARLQETFRGLPQEHIDNFMRMVEQGQYQNVTRWLAIAGVLFPLARKMGRETLSKIMSTIEGN